MYETLIRTYFFLFSSFFFINQCTPFNDWSTSTRNAQVFFFFFFFFFFLLLLLLFFCCCCCCCWRPGGRGFNPRRGRQHSFVEIDHEIFSTVILSLPLIQEGHLSVSGGRMCTILVNRLQYCAHSSARNWQLPFLNQRKGENDRVHNTG